MSASELTKEHLDLILDGTKIAYYKDRVEQWERGERFAPITIDLALTTTCNMGCEFCYRFLQHNTKYKITKDHMTSFLDDAAEIGVKGVSLVSDGESSISPAYQHTIEYGNSLGISMASGTNAYLLRGKLLEAVFPKLTYLRVNISGGEEQRYNEIMGAKGDMFSVVCDNIRHMVQLRKEGKSNCTVGMQMVFMPQYEDQLIPLAKLAVELEADYLVIKHCSDDELGTIGVKYGDYEKCYDTLKAAESLSTDRTRIQVKWSKIRECSSEGAIRTYQRCYGAPFLLQISGTGLVAPCGMLFNERYKELAHIGNITQTRFKDIWQSERYWEVMKYLGSDMFNAQKQCGTLCLQHSVNRALDNHVKGNKIQFKDEDVAHKAFV
jgi:MoaA/NifB/PqqE/SkfB family radical SAM enzyme